MNKVCSCCKVEKDISEYSKWKYSSSGYNYACKQCSRNKLKAYESSWGGGVYLITTECGETYVGSSKELRRRKYKHNLRVHRGNESCIAGKYQIKSFKILQKVEPYDRDIAEEAEREWIKKLNPTLNKIWVQGD